MQLLTENQSGKCGCLKNSEIVAKDIAQALSGTNKSTEQFYRLFEELV